MICVILCRYSQQNIENIMRIDTSEIGDNNKKAALEIKF